jgi:Tfp pilus assembly protein PilP
MRRLITVCLPLVLLVGCEEFNNLPTATPPPVNVPKLPTPPPPVQTPEQAQEQADYQRPEYPENLRRNPFQPNPEVVRPINQPVDTGRDVTPLDPLEMYSINQLQLAAIISEVDVPKAMFISPDGFGHVVKEGDRIGRNKGVITDIRDNEVDIQENTSEGDNAASRVRTLTLRAAELSSEGGDDLTEAERAALEKLLDSEAGRRALRDKLRNQSQSASAIQGGEAPPAFDSRFGGIEPPK